LFALPEVSPSVIGALLVAPLPANKKNNTQAWVGRLVALNRLLREHGGAPELTNPALKMVKEALGSASGQVKIFLCIFVLFIRFMYKGNTSTSIYIC